jgi:hypothetical protein
MHGIEDLVPPIAVDSWSNRCCAAQIIPTHPAKRRGQIRASRITLRLGRAVWLFGRGRKLPWRGRIANLPWAIPAPQLAQSGYRLGPDKDLSDAFADAPRDGVEGMARSAAVDRRASPALVLGNMRRVTSRFAARHDKIATIATFTGAERQRRGRSAKGSIRVTAASRSA